MENISPSVLVIGVPEASTRARPGFFVSRNRDFTSEVPGALASRSDRCPCRRARCWSRRRACGTPAASSTMIWSTPISEMVSRSGPFASASPSRRSCKPSFSRSRRLRETRCPRRRPWSDEILVELQLIVDHLLFEGRRHGDEPEGRVRDDRRRVSRWQSPRAGSRKRAPLVLGEVRLVGDEEDRAVGVERQKLSRRLCQAMTGDDEHGLGDQPQAALLHDRSCHRHCLAGADRMRKIGRT